MYEDNYEDEGTIQASFSVSQATEHTRSSTNKTNERQIEVDEKRAELRAAYELAEAREAKAKAERAETFAKLRLEEANLEAEQRRFDCSERGSSVAATPKSGFSLRRGSKSSKMLASKAELKNGCIYLQKMVKLIPQTKDNDPDKTRKLTENAAHTKRWIDGLTNPNDQKMNYDNVEETLPKTVFTITKSLTADNENVAVHQYLERLGRNEFINLALQIAYNGNNTAFVFYENLIRNLMNESPHEERRLEVLRASCVGQPREMINLFFAPLRGITTSQRIERALDRLHQRYGVSGGFVSESKVIVIRDGTKVNHTIASLKALTKI